MPLTLRPIDVYNAYPGSDLIPLPKPEPADTFESYVETADHRDIIHCGDTLYAFILFELRGAESDEEALRLIQTGIRDLQTIETKLQEILNDRS